jgi:predicted metal-dependent HD superfamily phosphohydrolase
MIHFERWATMWSRLGAGAGSYGATVFQAVIQAYSEPHRRYHTLVHLQDCLQQFDTACSLAMHPVEVEAALWFHDAIYDPRSSENEARSAQWAQEALQDAGVSTEIAQRVADLVLVTRHHACPVGTDACVLVDIDLSILGRAPAEFDVYERQIREEYAWVPEPTFRQRRADILQSFLTRRVIYETPLFQSRYEAQARQNLARSIARLQA